MTRVLANRTALAGIVRAGRESRSHSARRWHWAALLLGVVYLSLLATQLGAIVGATYLDADTASGPVIAQLFGSAGPHASIVLGTFGWYSTLLFDLGTGWLPFHREIWEGAPYAMVLGAAALTAWSVWQVAGRWAAALSAVLMICVGPHTLHLLLSTTEHAPDWFCLALLGGYLVLLERGLARRPGLVVVSTVLVGVVVGVNAASDVLVAIAGLVPFVLALLACWVSGRGQHSVRAAQIGIVMLVVSGISWAITRSVMSDLHVGPMLGSKTGLLAARDQVASNFKLWWQSIAVLGNGDFFGRKLSFTSGLAVICAALSIGAVVLIPRIGWRKLRLGTGPVHAHGLAFIVFWCSSAIMLTAAFLVSATPVDIQADRYLVGLIYAAAAVIPVAAAGRPFTERAAAIGTVLFALAATISMAHGTTAQKSAAALSESTVNRVARIAERSGLRVGYAGYWDAAPITWSTSVRIRVYPVQTCSGHLCRFYLHYISSWYSPRPRIATFLLTDAAVPLVPVPPGNLGPPSAVYNLGQITMYVYPYDLASRISS